jgi:hypothetical protein
MIVTYARSPTSLIESRYAMVTTEVFRGPISWLDISEGLPWQRSTTDAGNVDRAEAVEQTIASNGRMVVVALTDTLHETHVSVPSCSEMTSYRRRRASDSRETVEGEAPRASSKLSVVVTNKTTSFIVQFLPP